MGRWPMRCRAVGADVKTVSAMTTLNIASYDDGGRTNHFGYMRDQILRWDFTIVEQQIAHLGSDLFLHVGKIPRDVFTRSFVAVASG